MIHFFGDTLYEGENLHVVHQEGETTYIRVRARMSQNYDAKLGASLKRLRLTKGGLDKSPRGMSPLDRFTDELIFDQNPIGLRIEGEDHEGKKAVIEVTELM